MKSILILAEARTATRSRSVPVSGQYLNVLVVGGTYYALNVSCSFIEEDPVLLSINYYLYLIGF